MSDPRRSLPAVGALLESEDVRPLLAHHARAQVAAAARRVVDAARRGERPAPEQVAGWAAAIGDELAAADVPSLRAVVNATGVVLHTNLGRAPLADAALAAIAATADGGCNLEYDLEAGARGSRYVHCAALLRELIGAEDALVVNNCAAALVLALNTLAEGRDVAVSRGELVEIGGSFRVPDIMQRSGARLLEVGTTNRTHREDYEQALDAGAAAIIKVHRSNFTIGGFTAEVPLADLAGLARARGVPLLHDFGSGLLQPLDDVGLGGEPTAGDAVRAGATLVLMSGDKLLGGPQAGVVVGERAAVARLRANPLARALRVDKLTLAALEATLRLYRDPAQARREIPALAMLAAPADDVRRRAERAAAALAAAGVAATVVETEATVGGGAYPSARLASWALALDGDAVALERRLRGAPLPVIGRIADDRLLLDLRSVPAAHDGRLLASVAGALA